MSHAWNRPLRWNAACSPDHCGRHEQIDREAGTFAVRPYRRRKSYALPLGVVATMVCRAIVMAEAREKRLAKAKGRPMKVARRRA